MYRSVTHSRLYKHTSCLQCVGIWIICQRPGLLSSTRVDTPRQEGAELSRCHRSSPTPPREESAGRERFAGCWMMRQSCLLSAPRYSETHSLLLHFHSHIISDVLRSQMKLFSKRENGMFSAQVYMKVKAHWHRAASFFPFAYFLLHEPLGHCEKN